MTDLQARIDQQSATMYRWHWLFYLDGPSKGATALVGFWLPGGIPAELSSGYRLAPRGRGYTLAPPTGGYMF
jgi:hypothetical protein